MAFDVRINGLSGQLGTIEAEETWTAWEAKKAIQTTLGVPMSEQRLLRGNKELLDHDDLGQGCSDDMGLTLLRRTPEQAALLEQLRANIKDSAQLRRIPEHLFAEREAVMIMVQHNGFLLQLADASLRADPDVVLAAVRRSAFALQHAVEILRTDRDFVLRAVACNGFALACAAEDLRADRQVVLLAVRVCRSRIAGGSRNCTSSCRAEHFCSGVCGGGTVGRSDICSSRHREGPICFELCS